MPRTMPRYFAMACPVTSLPVVTIMMVSPRWNSPGSPQRKQGMLRQHSLLALRTPRYCAIRVSPPGISERTLVGAPVAPLAAVAVGRRLLEVDRLVLLARLEIDGRVGIAGLV